MDRGAYGDYSPWGHKSKTQLKRLITFTHSKCSPWPRSTPTIPGKRSPMQNLTPTELESTFEQVSHVHTEFGKNWLPFVPSWSQPPLAQKPQAPYKSVTEWVSEHRDFFLGLCFPFSTLNGSFWLPSFPFSCLLALWSPFSLTIYSWQALVHLWKHGALGRLTRIPHPVWLKWHQLTS